MADSAPPPLTAEQAGQVMRSKAFAGLLVVAAVIGVLISLAAWCFLEAISQLQSELYTHLPNALGYTHGPPLWWSAPVLVVGALLVAVAIKYLPGQGGHLPAAGLAGGTTRPIDLPGVLLAGLAAVASGLVLGPEAPLLALGSGGALLIFRAARRQTAPQAVLVIGATGAFAAVSFIFSSPLIAAVLMIEVAGVGGAGLTLLVLPGLIGAGIGSLVSIGMGSFTGLSTSAYALGTLQLPHFGHPDLVQFGWTIGLAAAVAVVARVMMMGGLTVHRVVARRVLILIPLAGLLVAGLAVAFHWTSGRDVDEVLFSGQSALPGLVANAGTWSVGALALLICFKGLAYSISLGSFRGGPTFPALLLAAAGGIMASRLPGYALTPGVAVAMAAGVASILGLPLSAVVLATVLTDKAGTGVMPLVIVGAVVAYLVTLLCTPTRSAPDVPPSPGGEAESAPVKPSVSATAPAAQDAVHT